MQVLTKYEWVAVFNRKSAPSPARVRSSIERGIPDYLRGDVWVFLTKAKEVANKYPLLVYLDMLKQTDSSIESAISKDINRTFPEHDLFKDADGPGQTGIFNILKAYSQFDREVGYCQGMAFIAGLLVMHIHSEELAFWAFVSIMTELNWREIFTENTPQIERALFSLKVMLQAFLPEVHSHFEEEEVPFGCFVGFYITLFSYKTPLEFAVRVFDLFLIKGEDAITQTLFKMISLKKDTILEKQTHELFRYLSSDFATECFSQYSISSLLHPK